MAKRRTRRPSYKAQVADLKGELARLTAERAAQQEGATPQVAPQAPPAMAATPELPSTTGVVPSPLHGRMDRIEGLIRELLAKVGAPHVDTAPPPDPRDTFISMLPADQQDAARQAFGLSGTTAGTTGDVTEVGHIRQRDDLIVPLLAALSTMPNGRGAVRQVVAAVESRIGKQLTPADREKISTGAVRWENALMWARQHAIKAGLLADGMPRGIWAITPDGRAFLKSHTR